MPSHRFSFALFLILCLPGSFLVCRRSSAAPRQSPSSASALSLFLLELWPHLLSSLHALSLLIRNIPWHLPPVLCPIILFLGLSILLLAPRPPPSSSPLICPLYLASRFISTSAHHASLSHTSTPPTLVSLLPFFYPFYIPPPLLPRPFFLSLSCTRLFSYSFLRPLSTFRVLGLAFLTLLHSPLRLLAVVSARLLATPTFHHPHTFPSQSDPTVGFSTLSPAPSTLREATA